jgi:hypothetical protein
MNIYLFGLLTGYSIAGILLLTFLLGWFFYRQIKRLYNRYKNPWFHFTA